MHILQITPSSLPDVNVIRIKRFHDDRGYFSEVFRQDRLLERPELPFLQGKQFVQQNESRSKGGVLRGLHAQCQPELDKLLRVLQGHVIDIALDIRPHSPTFGKAVAFELKYDPSAEHEDMILVPFGFAHGVIMLEDSRIQYLQTGYWSKDGESAIVFNDPEIDWSLLSSDLRQKVAIAIGSGRLSEKDQQALTLQEWAQHSLSEHYSA